MKLANLDERKNSLEVTTYANSLRVPLRRTGVFLKGDKAVGLLLPPDADVDTYQQAVQVVMAGAKILHYAVPVVRVSGFRNETDAINAIKTLSRSKAVIVVIAHGADLPPELRVSLDRLEHVAAIKPYHLVLAAKSVLGMVIDRDQATALFGYPLPSMFAAIKKSRPIEITLEKLEVSVRRCHIISGLTASVYLVGDEQAGRQLQEPSFSSTDHRPGRVALFSVSAKPSIG
jgi:cell division protease FtsH